MDPTAPSEAINGAFPGERFALPASVCGFCGVIGLDDDLPQQIRGSISAMTDRLKHRGPDGGAVRCAPWYALGHRRLAIIDRAGGEQPMSNEDRSVWIAFNGEIYNHHELRRELQARGHQFRTHSDTEAIIHAYEEYGDKCVERLDGMFAFAIADENHRRVLLARDRLGKKPLFHAAFGGVLHFASEIKAIKASPLWNGEQDLDAIEGYLSLGYFIAPSTAYRHVKKLEPAHVLAASRSGITIRKYWDIAAFDSDTRPRDQLLQSIDECLRSAVARRLESEVPIVNASCRATGTWRYTTRVSQRRCDMSPICSRSKGPIHFAFGPIAARHRPSRTCRKAQQRWLPTARHSLGFLGSAKISRAKSPRL